MMFYWNGVSVFVESLPDLGKFDCIICVQSQNDRSFICAKSILSEGCERVGAANKKC